MGRNVQTAHDVFHLSQNDKQDRELALDHIQQLLTKLHSQQNQQIVTFYAGKTIDQRMEDICRRWL